MQSVFSQYADADDGGDQTGTRPLKQRRRREALACAECRRLKLKCNRSWPCSTCTRRGCAAICPTGTMTAGKSGRLILANTSSLHERIAVLCERVRSLEDAVGELAGPSHPLLAESLLELKAPLQADSLLETSDGKETGTSLRATPARRPGDAEPQDQPDLVENGPEPKRRALTELLELGRSFPLPLEEDELIDAAGSIQDIKAMLPPLVDAQTLTESFFDDFSPTFAPVPKPNFVRILNEAYELAPGRTDLDGVHKLALVFLAFALANFQDVQSQAEASLSSETYFYLAKALFCIRSCVESRNDITVHGLLMIATYCRLTNRTSATWTVLGITTKLVIGNNLHRDPARWGMEAETSALRRYAFWETYSFDTLYTLCVQRPPLYNMSYIDCDFPALDLHSSDPAVRTTANFLWKYRYSSEIVPKLMEEIYGRKVLTYTSILEMDKMIRASWVPECLQLDRQNPIGFTEDSLRSTAIQRFYILWYRELALLFLHRTLLAIALTENREDPLQHRFSPSVLASFRSAYKLTSALRTLAAIPQTQGQHICFWQPGFAATTVLGSIALLVPHSPLGQTAGTETLATCDLYEKSTIPVPSKVMIWLVQLKQKLQQAQIGIPQASDVSAPDWEQFGDDDGLISTRALASHVRREVPSVSHGVPPPAAQPQLEPPEPDFFADLLAPQVPPTWSNSSLMNDPIAFDYFPPVDMSVGIVPESTFAGWQPPPASLPEKAPSDPYINNPALGSLSQQTSTEVEVSSQWERFLNSLGLSESQEPR